MEKAIAFSLALYCFTNIFSQEIVNRPQEPKPPFPYKIEEVSYPNSKDTAVHLAATLTIPKGKGPFPAILLISGSGQSERDMSFHDHKMYFVLADYLTRIGIATLRFDDRGAGKSTLGSKKIMQLTTDDFLSDANAGFDFLKTRPEIDPLSMALLGHSEGTQTAQLMTVNPDNRINRLILLAAGTMLKGEIVAEQSEAISRLENWSIAAQKADSSFIQRCLVIMKQESNMEKRLQLMTKVADEELLKVPEMEKEKTDKAMRVRVKILSSENFYKNATEPQRDLLREIECPVLAINGGKDVLVSARIAVPRLKASLATNAASKVIYFPALNHMMQTAKTGLMDEVKYIEETISPEVLDKIGRWLLK